MGLTLGLTPEEMRTLARQFTTKAGEVRAIEASITNLLEGTSWTGRRASEFRSAWNGPFRRSLAQLAEELDKNAGYINDVTTSTESALN
ncbi:MAG: hypothetical protein JJLCMIEE_01939 [Acidimicrobiales bacterium]|nr:hypothetical protein [Acidimicrobiales bacterium]